MNYNHHYHAGNFADLVKHLTPTYSASIKDSFTSNMKDDCPIVSYSITKVIDKNSKIPIA